LNPVTTTPPNTHEVHFGEENTITATEASLAVKTLKAAGCDEIRPDMLKALNQGVLWLTRVCHVTWCSGRSPKDWQTGVIIPNTKEETESECTNYRGISLLSLPGHVYAKCLEKRCCKIIELKLDDTQDGIRPGHSTTRSNF